MDHHFPTDFLQNTLSHRTGEECEGDVEVGSLVEYVLSTGGCHMPITTRLTSLQNLPSRESTKCRTDLNLGTCSGTKLPKNEPRKACCGVSTPGRLGLQDFSKHGLHLLHDSFIS